MSIDYTTFRVHESEKNSCDADITYKTTFDCKKAIRSNSYFYHNTVNNGGYLTEKDIITKVGEKEVRKTFKPTYEDHDRKSHHSHLIRWEIEDKLEGLFHTSIELIWRNGFKYNIIEYFVLNPINYGTSVEEIVFSFDFPRENAVLEACDLYEIKLKGVGKAKKNPKESSPEMPIIINPKPNCLYLCAIKVNMIV